MTFPPSCRRTKASPRPSPQTVRLYRVKRSSGSSGFGPALVARRCRCIIRSTEKPVEQFLWRCCGRGKRTDSLLLSRCAGERPDGGRHFECYRRDHFVYLIEDVGGVVALDRED